MLNTLVVVVVVVAVVVRRLVGEPLNARDLLVPPVALIAIGGYGLTKLDHLRAADLAWIAGGALAGVAFGIVRGLTVRLFVKNGVLWQRYTAWTLVAWAVTTAASVGLSALAMYSGLPEQARPITLSLGVGLLGELIAIGPRALRSRVPFAASQATSLPAQVRTRSSR